MIVPAGETFSCGGQDKPGTIGQAKIRLELKPMCLIFREISRSRMGFFFMKITKKLDFGRSNTCHPRNRSHSHAVKGSGGRGFKPEINAHPMSKTKGLS